MSNWYPRYYGDYMRDTSHLTLAEHGAYTVILDHYYATGRPLPDDSTAIMRICRAFTDAEQAAVNSVLGQFFTRNGDGYHNRRADAEITKEQAIATARAIAGREGARSKWHGKRMANATTSTSTSISIPTSTSIDPPIPPRGAPHRQPTMEQKKRLRVKANSPVMVTMGAWFGRKPDTLWTVYDAEALAELGDIDGDELAVVGEYYTATISGDEDIRRKNIATLLNNWSGEVDRARGWKAKRDRHKSIFRD